MSVIAFVGHQGSGKSYGVVAHVVLQACKAGRTIVTNIPLNLDLLKADYPMACVVQLDKSLKDFEDGHKFDELPPGAVVILDEVWEIWPAGMKADKAPAGAKEFLAKHRHQVGQDGRTSELVLVTQDLKQIAAFARLHVQKTYVAHKLWQLGLRGSYRVEIYSGGVEGLRGPKERLLSQIQGRYNGAVWRYYKSHTQAKDGVVGDEQPVDNRGIVWKNPAIWLGLPIAVASVGFAIFWLPTFLFSGGGKAEADVVRPVAAAQDDFSAEVREYMAETAPPRLEAQRSSGGVLRGSGAAPHRAAVDPVREVVSQRWRLAAVIEVEDGATLFAVVDRSGAMRRIAQEDCTLDPVGEWGCVVDGEMATGWSGVAGRTPSIMENVARNSSGL